MSMSTHVIGLRPPDERWQQMKAVWEACQAAGIALPPEVEAFFDGLPPDPIGVEVKLEGTPAVRPYRSDYRDGFEVDVRALPPDVTVVRFFNSY